MFPDSTLAIPIDDLYPFSDTNEVTFRVTALFQDESSREVLVKTLTLPVIIEEEPVVEEPVLIPHDPR